MNKKIVILSILTVVLLLLVPHISAINVSTVNLANNEKVDIDITNILKQNNKMEMKTSIINRIIGMIIMLCHYPLIPAVALIEILITMFCAIVDAVFGTEFSTYLAGLFTCRWLAMGTLGPFMFLYGRPPNDDPSQEPYYNTDSKLKERLQIYYLYLEYRDNFVNYLESLLNPSHC